jgi:hypothetical protein
MTKSTIPTLIGFIALIGCAQVRYPSYYTLNLPNRVSASRDSGQIPATIAVREFRAPPYLRQGPIVYRPESEQLAFYDYHRWAENPRQRVTTAIVSLLTQVFDSAELYDGRIDAEFLLSGSLDHLEDVDHGGIVSVDQRSLPGIVAEMSRDLNEAATQLVSSMRSQVPQSSFRTNND